MRDAELALGALDLVDDHLGVALAELVALVDRRDAEVARVGAAAAGLDDDVGLALERQRVVLERHEIPGRKRHGQEARERALGGVRDDLGAAPPGDRRHRRRELGAEGAARRRARRWPPRARRRSSRPPRAPAPSTGPARSRRAGRTRPARAPKCALRRAISATSASSVGVVLGNTISSGRKPSASSCAIAASVESFAAV